MSLLKQVIGVPNKLIKFSLHYYIGVTLQAIMHGANHGYREK